MSDQTPDAAEQPPAGIVCPRCRGTDWRVSDTRKVRSRLVRVRVCKGCFIRIRTREVIEAVVDAAAAGGSQRGGQ